MKHLKTYKIFESNDENWKKISIDELNTIEDILIGIKDLNYDIDFCHGERHLIDVIKKEFSFSQYRPMLLKANEVCRIYIEKQRPREYKPDKEFVSILQHLVSYIQEIGFNIIIESFQDGVLCDSIDTRFGKLSDDDVSIFSRYELEGTGGITHMKITIMKD